MIHTSTCAQQVQIKPILLSIIYLKTHLVEILQHAYIPLPKFVRHIGRFVEEKPIEHSKNWGGKSIIAIRRFVH